ncbi:hypothetical protein HJFPF1_07166 [Paramyrothecium foliicola]|nr:hypothetical protein HJFPF1_07166 [Paramyrothecium foliicola]
MKFFTTVVIAALQLHAVTASPLPEDVDASVNATAAVGHTIEARGNNFLASCSEYGILYPQFPSQLYARCTDKSGATKYSTLGLNKCFANIGGGLQITQNYHFWADVPAKKHDQICALPKRVVQGESSVKCRGLFINDEESALNGWLRANYLWPAIHHEPMQRATNEWNVSETGAWDWSKNSKNITNFMEYGIERAGSNESYFTLGMRGLGDEAMKESDAAKVLAEVFEVQRGIIQKYHGAKDAIPQVWALYKEVMHYYNAGLRPAEDVTLLFPDDNFGNVHRLPTGNESYRVGGCGIYYHLEYVGAPRSYKWANSNNLAKVYKELSQAYLRDATRIWIINVGDVKPMELPLNMAMDMAWNMDRFSPNKLLSYLQNYAAREFGQVYAEETAKILLEFSHLNGFRRFDHIEPSTFLVDNYHEAERVLGRWKALAARVRSIYDQMPDNLKPAYYQLVYYPAATGALLYSVVIGIGMNYRQAQERRNSANQLAHEILALFDKSYDFVEAWDAMLGRKWEKMMPQAIFDAVPQQPKLWANPSRDMLTNISFVQLRQNMQFSQGNLGIYAEESDSPIQQARWAESVDSSMPTVQYPALLPVMDPYGPQLRHVDLFHRGDYRVPIDWVLADMPESWISFRPASGTVGGDNMVQRLNITIDWDNVPDNFNDTIEIGITATPAELPYFDLIRIPVLKTRVPDDFEGFPESAGFISIESPHFQRSSGHNKTVHLEKIPYLGSRSESGSLAVRPYKQARQGNISRDAWVEYDFYLFTWSESTTAILYLTTGLETDPQLKMQYSLTLDDAPANMTRVLNDYISVDHVGDVPPIWMSQLMDQVWTLQLGLGSIDAGAHTLRWAVNSPEIYLEKIVLDAHGGVKPSYLGPPETAYVGADD